MTFIFAPLKRLFTGFRQFCRSYWPARAAVSLIIVLAPTACSWFQFPGVFRLDIQQGNIVTQEMVDQLRIGMTKRQVNFILGTPLIQDSFNQGRWDYYYSLSNSSGEVSRKEFTVYFSDDALTHVEGDYQLSSESNEAAPEDDQSASL